MSTPDDFIYINTNYIIIYIIIYTNYIHCIILCGAYNMHHLLANIRLVLGSTLFREVIGDRFLAICLISNIIAK